MASGFSHFDPGYEKSFLYNYSPIAAYEAFAIDYWSGCPTHHINILISLLFCALFDSTADSSAPKALYGRYERGLNNTAAGRPEPVPVQFGS